ncbi:hypothetical protein SNARM312S_05936 [Streptomyces narbonensis]
MVFTDEPGAVIVGVKPPILTRAARGEGEHGVLLLDGRAVVGGPGLLGDGRAHRDDLVGQRGVADRLMPGPELPGRDDQLDAVRVDQAGVEARADVVAVVQLRQTADRHVDDVDAAVDDEVRRALGEGGVGAAAGPGAGARGDDLRTGGRAVHPAAEEAVGGGDAGDVRAVGGLDETDVDEVALLADPAAAERVDVLADLDDERRLLDDLGGRVVGTEVAGLVPVLVRLHRLVVREVVVLVGVHADGAGGRVVQHPEDVGGVAVTVDVTGRVAARGDRLGEAAELVGALLGAFQLCEEAVKTGPATGAFCRRQVASPSVIGSVAVTQSTILRSPVVVFWRAG